MNRGSDLYQPKQVKSNAVKGLKKTKKSTPSSN